MIYLLEDLCTVRPLTVQGKSLTFVIILSLQAFHLVSDHGVGDTVNLI